MSVYDGKLLELKGIKSTSNKYFLQVRLSFEQNIEFFWEIDEYTAKNLNNVMNFDENYKYRLSFSSSWDSIHKKYLSILTKTYCEESERIYFLCSEDYISKLTTIKELKHIIDVDKLTFISMDLPLVDEQVKEDKEQIEEKIYKKYIPKGPRRPVAIVSVLFVILFSYLSCIYLNKTVFDERVLAQSIESGNQVYAELEEHLDPEDNIITPDTSSVQHDIPFIKLDEEITYTIAEGKVALTFDDGPSQYTMEIMDILKKHEVGGTFFFTGRNVKKHPDYVQYIKSNGYSIGSHSMTHIDMKTASYEKQKSELIESIKLLEEITNDKILLFRPPYGSFNKNIRDLIHEHQYKMVLWDNDPEDWKIRDADKIFNEIQSSNVSGSIILLHESQAVIDALPKIIEYLQKLDLEIVNLQ